MATPRLRKQLTSPVAVVTGAGRGIGRAIAEAFAAEGHAIVIAERDVQLGERTVRALARGGAQVALVSVDIAEESAPRTVITTALRLFGRIDCLVNNAGVLQVGPLARTSAQEIDRVLSVNLQAPLLMSRAVLPCMLRQHRGTIVNIASQLGKTGLGGYVAYCASKFGVVGFTEAFADELHGTGVRVFAVCPGLTNTPMARLSGILAKDREQLVQPRTVARTVLDLVTGRQPADSGAAVDVY